MSRSFDGVNDNIVVIGVSNIDTTTRSVSLWVNPATFVNDTVGTIVYIDGSANSAGNSGLTVAVGRATNRVAVGYRWSTTSGFWSTNDNIISTNVWTHILVTYDRGATTNNPVIYINGISVAVNTEATPSGTAKTGISVFKTGENVGSTQDYSGLVSCIEYFTNILNINQSKQIMRIPGSLNSSNQKLFWWFSGTPTEVDYSGNGNHGSVTGATISKNEPPITGIFKKKRSSLHYIFFPPAIAVTGIAFDAASNSGYQAASSSYTFNRTVTGSNKFLTVDVALLSAGQTVTSIVDDNGGGNVQMVFIGAKSTVSSVGRVECWGLVNPASGTKQIQVNLSGSIASSSSAVSYTGVNQTSPYEGFNSNQATNVGAADATVSVTSVADNCWIHAAIATDDTAITANQTSRNNVTGAGGSGANEDTGPITPPASTTMSYTNVGALQTWAIAGYAIRPVGSSNLNTFINRFRKTLSGIGTRVGSRQVHGWN